jgi:FkbM family methyltransferase
MQLVRGWAFPESDRFMVGEMAMDGTYQLGHLEAALTHVTHFGTALDGGAHIGTWSKIMAQRFTRVIAIEPSPDTFECLDHNMRETGCGNVERLQVALGATPGVVSMALDAPNQARANTGARFAKAGGQIPVITIDSLHLTDLGFLKLDIEGSEPAALRGAKATLKRCRPIVLFENKWLWVRHFGLPKNAVRDFLIAQGYQQIAQIRCDQIWGPK